MTEPDRHRAFAHGGGGSTNRATPHITHGEDPRQAGLKQMRVAGAAFPGRSGFDVRPRKDEAVRIERDDAREPRRRRVGANKDEQRLEGKPTTLARPGALDDDGPDGVLPL